MNDKRKTISFDTLRHDSILKNHSFTLKGNKEKLIISTQINDISLPLPTDLYLYKDKGTLLAQEKKNILFQADIGYPAGITNDALTNFDFPGVTIQEVFESYQDTNQQLYREKLLLLICQTVILSIQNTIFSWIGRFRRSNKLNLLYHEKALLILICIHTFIPIGKLYAQDPYTEYKEFIKKQKQEYNDFRRKENQEFASFLKNYWKPYTKEEAIKAPTQPEPVNPVVYTDPLREPDRIPNVPTVPPLKINPEDKPLPYGQFLMRIRNLKRMMSILYSPFTEHPYAYQKYWMHHSA
ncbi:MAG: hypothetical protein V8T33_08975 [Parabacteroides distasonis]